MKKSAAVMLVLICMSFVLSRVLARSSSDLVVPSTVKRSLTFEFPVHVAVLTHLPAPRSFLDSELLARQIQLLNEDFGRSDHHPGIQFYLKSISFYEDLANSDCRLVKKLGHQTTQPSKEDRYQFFRECQDERVKDPGSINLFFFSSDYELDQGIFKSYGGTLQPWAMVNWQRLQRGETTIVAHEIGHIFSLWHLPVCVEAGTPTYLMASHSRNCQQTFGDRSLGVPWWQVRQMEIAAVFLQKTLGLK